LCTGGKARGRDSFTRKLESGGEKGGLRKNYVATHAGWVVCGPSGLVSIHKKKKNCRQRFEQAQIDNWARVSGVGSIEAKKIRRVQENCEVTKKTQGYR